MRRSLLLGALACGLSLHPRAATAEGAARALRFSDAYEHCMERSGGVTADMLDCIAAERDRWIRRLTTAYSAIMVAGHGPEARSLLVAAQRAWIAFQDVACAAEGEITAPGGALGSVALASCKLRMTAERAADLESLAALPKGAATKPEPQQQTPGWAAQPQVTGRRSP